MKKRPFRAARPALLSLLLVSAAFGARPPNLLVVLADNVGRDWFSCYGATQIQTPAIDRLAATGVRFEHFYATPLCSTTRVQFLTGRYGLRTGWHIHHDAGLYGGGGFDPAREITWARALRDAGYATALAGKWQINDPVAEPDAIQRSGFDEHLIWSGMRPGTGDADTRWRAAHQAAGDRSYEERYWDAKSFRNGKPETLTERYAPDVQLDFLVDFMERNRAKPFVAYYATSLPSIPTTHTPAEPKRDAPEAGQFAAMMRHLDAQMDRLVWELDRLTLRSDTIIIFATDNATPVRLAGPTARARERGGVRLMSEFDLDMPMIVNCPGRVPAGLVTEALTDASDIFPTMLSLAGVPLPRGVTLDGRSFAGLIGGAEKYVPREWVFGQYGGVRAIRDARFKLYSTGALYDLVADPMEKANLAASDAPGARAAGKKLGAALTGLPADYRLPFRYRSATAFQIEAGKWK
jgi:arylsulfatase A-like enzyme